MKLHQVTVHSAMILHAASDAYQADREAISYRQQILFPIPNDTKTSAFCIIILQHL
jgi:hypothetical protein